MPWQTLKRSGGWSWWWLPGGICCPTVDAGQAAAVCSPLFKPVAGTNSTRGKEGGLATVPPEWSPLLCVNTVSHVALPQRDVSWQWDVKTVASQGRKQKPFVPFREFCCFVSAKQQYICFSFVVGILGIYHIFCWVVYLFQMFSTMFNPRDIRKFIQGNGMF